MVSAAEIQDIANRIAEAANATSVFLFGSYARGDVRDSSDLDLLIVAESTVPRFRRSRPLYLMFRPYPCAMDLLVYTPQEFAEAAATPGSLIRSVIKEGKLIYDRGSSCGAAVGREGA